MAREGELLAVTWRLFLMAGAAAGISLLWFRRDPERNSPDTPSVILSPADGIVQVVEFCYPPVWLPGPAWRIAIFLRLWDVHVQRAPVTGKVLFYQVQRGSYKPAIGQQARHNYGHWLGFGAGWGKVLVLRTAGLVARRVTTRVHMGQMVYAGERIGRILLGSRAEIYLPAGTHPLVAPGDVVRAGESVVACRLEE